MSKWQFFNNVDQLKLFQRLALIIKHYVNVRSTLDQPQLGYEKLDVRYFNTNVQRYTNVESSLYLNVRLCPFST